MKMTKWITTLGQRIRDLTAGIRRRRFGSTPAARQLQLELDELTGTGLRLRDALPVRSAEFWLLLGQPHLAEEELRALPENLRCHPWPLRVQIATRHAKKLAPNAVTLF